MEGQFLVRQIYDDAITYNLIGAAEEVLGMSKTALNSTTPVESISESLSTRYLENLITFFS